MKQQCHVHQTIDDVVGPTPRTLIHMHYIAARATSLHL